MNLFKTVKKAIEGQSKENLERDGPSAMTIRMEPDLMEKIDLICKKLDVRSRNQLITQIVRVFVNDFEKESGK